MLYDKFIRFLQRSPLLFLSNEVSATVLQCAMAAATLNHRDAFSSVMKYFRDLIRLPKDLVCIDAACIIMVNTISESTRPSYRHRYSGTVFGSKWTALHEWSA